MSNDKSIDINTANSYVEGYNAIRQSWQIILNTIKGSDPLRPTFGSTLFDYVDKPLNIFEGEFYNTIVKDLENWERRATINQLKIKTDGSKLYLYVAGIYTETNTKIETTLTIDEIFAQTNLKSYSNAYSKFSYN